LRATSVPCGACDAAGWVPEHACAGCGGRGAVAAERAIEVVIPAGLRAGATVTVAGAGLPARGRGQAGDLRVVLDLAPGRWEVAGTDWTGPVEVPFWLALAGGTWEADTPWGPRVVALPPGTREGAVLRLGGLGVGRQGDGFLIVRLRWPERLTPDERSALRQWGEGVIAREAAAGDSASVDTGGAG
jgi:molecular chaperone DnaJ